MSERPYIITAKGIEDLPDTKTAQDLIEKTEKYEKNQSESLRDKKTRGKSEEEPKTEETAPVEEAKAE